MAIPSQGQKTCRACGQSKPVGDFYRTAPVNGIRYLQSECKVCHGKRSRAIFVKNRAVLLPRWNEYARAKRASLKDEVFSHYGGWACACCDETERLFLTLDHTNNDGAEFRRQIAGRQTAAGYVTYRWLKRNGFPDGFQVLCANCQHGKRMNAGICPHRARRNDHSLVEVGSSGPKRIASLADDEMISTSGKPEAA